ncbi:MAG: ATP-dependent DNA helicase RecQ [Candidatus Kapaibacterium sp.]
MRHIEALEKYFKFSSYRPGQQEIVESILSGKDTLVVMPTGGGKSLCYQVPAICADGTAIIFSPLVALMKDQVDALTAKKIPAAMINSSLKKEQTDSIYLLAAEGRLKALYIAPERINSRDFSALIQNIRISFIAVDEAHCVSMWGHDFRPDYRNIPMIFETAGNPPVIALTATATPEVRKDIIRGLRMKHVNEFVRGFDRPNLSYKVYEPKNKAESLVKIIKKIRTGSIIVYSGTRKKVEQNTKLLRDNRIKADPYHAGLNPILRKSIQERFISGDTRVIVATNAFGMGIDKPDVRAVIHTELPGGIESYYQEAGRAGRDGLPADCILLYNYGDEQLQEFFIDSGYPEKKDISRAYNAIREKRLLDETALANYLDMPLFKLNNILRILERSGDIIKHNADRVVVKLYRDGARIREFLNSQSDRRFDAAEAILKSISHEAFYDYTPFDPVKAAAKYGGGRDDIMKMLEQMSFSGLLEYSIELNGGMSLKKNAASPEIDHESIENRKKIALTKLSHIISYALTPDCKRNYILKYFDDNEHEGLCGRCTSCR